MLPRLDDPSKAVAEDFRLETACIQTPTAFFELRKDWNDLFARAKCDVIFLSFDWMAEWWEHWGGSHELFLITVRDVAGTLVALAPLCIRRPNVRWLGNRVLAFMGSTGVASDHLNFLVHPGLEVIAAREIVRALLAGCHRWDYVELADADADSVPFTALYGELKEAGLSDCPLRRPARPYAQLPANFEEFLAGLAHRVRKNFRRGLRALEREGKLEFVCLKENSEIQERFGEFLQLHRQRFDQLEKTSAFLEPKLQAFHQGLLKRMADRTWPRLYLLQVDGKTVAAIYGFALDNRFAFYQSGMDPSWTRLSAGMIILGCSIQQSVESGHTEFDFLRGTQAYKLFWTKNSRRALTARFFDNRMRGRLAWARFASRAEGSRAKARLTAAISAMRRHVDSTGSE
jgi:CelD/BcsL family acetyltransferase involved in cellulose biosynthesis